MLLHAEVMAMIQTPCLVSMCAQPLEPPALTPRTCNAVDQVAVGRCTREQQHAARSAAACCIHAAAAGAAALAATQPLGERSAVHPSPPHDDIAVRIPICWPIRGAGRAAVGGKGAVGRRQRRCTWLKMQQNRSPTQACACLLGRIIT